MYMQHRHMVCGELHICRDLVLYQNVNDNSYSTPLLHKALDVDHEMVMLGIGWYKNTFSHLCVKLQHCPEHDTLCMSILFYWIFSHIYLMKESVFTVPLRHIFLELFSQTDNMFVFERTHYNLLIKCF